MNTTPAAVTYTDTITYDPTVDTTPEGVDPKAWEAFQYGRISLRQAKRMGII